MHILSEKLEDPAHNNNHNTEINVGGKNEETKQDSRLVRSKAYTKTTELLICLKKK